MAGDQVIIDWLEALEESFAGAHLFSSVPRSEVRKAKTMLCRMLELEQKSLMAQNKI